MFNSGIRNDQRVSNLNVRGDTRVGTMNVSGDIFMGGGGLVYPKVESPIIPFAKTVSTSTYTYRNPGVYTDKQLIRLTPSAYGDGLNTLSGSARPNPRTISNVVCDQPDNISVPNSVGATDMFVIFGQFLDHDLSLSTDHYPHESIDISIPSGDAYFDPTSTGTVILPLTRSVYDPTTGITGPREQLTQITSEIDASNVYGSDSSRSTWLRSFTDGKLKMSTGMLLPLNDGTQSNAGSSGNAFVAGDVRANENVGLLCLHTLFLREHNFWADELKKAGLTSDEDIYQRARVITESIIQAITFNEFLPTLLGESAILAYSGYTPGVPTTISNEFSTAAYRIGHSIVSEVLYRLDEGGSSIPQGNLTLRDAFFKSDRYAHDGDISSVFRGITTNACQKLDTKIVNSLRNFLFGQPGAGGLDLPALNIQRGRDHGIADYNSVRVALGLTAKLNFTDISSDIAISTALSTAYSGDISKIDLWIGGLSEDPVAGSQLGEVFHHIVQDQFLRTRSGDIGWYENRLTPAQVKYINSIKLSHVIARNTNAVVQEDCMKIV